jgi:phosphatidylethanolamine-binding protein (PEBP) family uncharacterized protein
MDYVERALAWVLSSRRGHDAGLFHKTSPFAKVSEPTIPVESPEIGPSGSKIPTSYGFFDKSLFPAFTWPQQTGAKEYLLVVEDPDAPLAEPVVHGLYYGLPASKTSVTNEDFQKIRDDGSSFDLKGGFKYGQNRRGTVYIPPRGLLGHGPHRYFYQIVALSEPIDTSTLSPAAKKEEIIKQIDGTVISWGSWQGVWERT